MNKKNSLADKFDCVEMKHKAARIISHKLSKMTREEELTYWREKTKHFQRRQSTSKHKLTKV